MSHRTRLLALIALLVWAASPVQASFIIALQNGREMRTSQVWEEGAEVKFITPQGTMGVPKALVKSIKALAPARGSAPKHASRHEAPDADRAATGTRAEARPPSPADPRRDAKTPPEQTTGGSRERHAADAQADRAKKRHLMQQLHEATETYLASSAARYVEAKQAALSSMRAYSTQVIDLEEDVKRRHGGVLPPWWADEPSAVASTSGVAGDGRAGTDEPPHAP